MLEPTDRSMPPEMMTKVMPTATTKLMEICWNTLRKLEEVKNTGEAMARSRHSASSAITMPSTLLEEPSFLTPLSRCFFFHALRAVHVGRCSDDNALSRSCQLVRPCENK